MGKAIGLVFKNSKYFFLSINIDVTSITRFYTTTFYILAIFDNIFNQI